MKKFFSNLYLQTEYNFLSSTISLKKLKEQLYRFEGYEKKAGLAIVENGMFGAYKFYKTVKDNEKIKPIFGLRCKLYNPNIENVCLLYAKDKEGYEALLEISSDCLINPKLITLDYLKEKQAHLICIIPFLENEIRYYYDNKNFSYLNETLSRYKNCFNDLYMGLSIQDPMYFLDDLVATFNELGVAQVAIHKTANLKEADLKSFQVLNQIKVNGKNNQNASSSLSVLDQNAYLLTNEELLDAFSNHLELIDNQEKIVDSCNVTLGFEGYLQPKAILEDGENAKDTLEKLCKEGLNKRIQEGREIFHKDYRGLITVYRDRLLHELDVIDKMGFNDYFLIVSDYVHYAKTHDILVGPSRGSAGGSLACFALGITEIDPIEYGLLFERFLNIERQSMPDIDVDFQDNKREEIFNYLITKYGKDKVAHIVTFGTLKPRMAINDCARVRGINDKKLKEITKYIGDSTSKLSLSEMIENCDMLKRMMASDEDVRWVLENALAIENFPRTISTHASGIIMAPSSLTHYTALFGGANGLLQTQYDEYDLEELGLVKMDILGLKNLTIIQDALSLIKRKNKDFDYDKIPLDDSNVYSLFRNGDTTGIFQFDRFGVKKVLANLRVNSISDLSQATSLYRPGPMESIPEFINRKNNPGLIIYMDPSIEECLKETYGIIVYQEQIMLIACLFAGYTLGEADVLRKAVSKKKKAVMEQEKTKFIEKAVLNHKTQKQASTMFDYIEKFASYGFNKSHAVAYSVLAYKMAYLKYYYYEAYMCALLNDCLGDVTKQEQYFSECKQKGVRIFVPMINRSEMGYICEGPNILLPLSVIKEVPKPIISRIMDERENAPFTSFDDFMKRLLDCVERKWVCKLIYAGCFDTFKEPRKSLVENYDKVLDYSRYSSSDSTLTIKKREQGTEEFTFEEISLLEKEALGMNVKYNLFIHYYPVKEKYHTTDLNCLRTGKTSLTLVMVQKWRVTKTKKGDDMAFFVASDDTASFDAVVFPRNYASLNFTPKDGDVVLISGTLENSKDASNNAPMGNQNIGIDKKNIIVNQMMKIN